MSARNLIFGFGCWLLFAGSTFAAADSATLTMQVVPTINSENQVLLRFRLRYDGQRSVEADVATLPGIQDRFTMRVDAHSLSDWDVLDDDGPCSTLKDIIKINEPSPGWRVVKPGEEFVEEIPLAELYTGIESAIGRCEIVVNWSYKMYTRDRIRFPRMAGSVVIPTSLRPVVPPEIRVQGEPWTSGVGK